MVPGPTSVATAANGWLDTRLALDVSSIEDRPTCIAGCIRDHPSAGPLASVRADRCWLFPASAGLPSEEFWPGAERINYFVLFPALLFSSLATAPLDNPALPQLAGAVMLGLGLAWVGLLIASCAAGPLAASVPSPRACCVSTPTSGWRRSAACSAEGLALAALMLALMVPTVNVMSVWALTAERGVSVRGLLLPIAKNPLILACLTGALVNLSGLELPGGTDRLLGLLAAASLPLGLRASARRSSRRNWAKSRRWAGTARYVCSPCPCLRRRGRARPASDGNDHPGAVLRPAHRADGLRADPPARRRQPPMAGIITLQTLLAAASLPLVLTLLNG